jgi:hypothetical protein
MSNEEIFRNIMARTNWIQGNEMKWNKMMISTFYYTTDWFFGINTYYLGGRKINGTFKWINGDDMPTSLDYWYYNPIVYDGSNRECVAIGNRNYRNYKLYAAYCDDTYIMFFCES